MIIFHEGLPGSGKSYEAAINQIIPALLKGRSVYAYIEGLNRLKFSEITGIPLEKLTELLHPLTKEQVPDIQIHVADNSLVLIDELQDFFPAGKTTLPSGVTEFVTQHRHRGIDIICMGQDHRDCHMLWKRRIDTLLRFVKRDALGMPGSYTWTTYKQQAGKFVQLRSGKGVYDSKYFGLYASHSDGVTSIDAHTDDRINIFKSSAFTFWLPVFLAVLSFAGYYLWGFFHGSGMSPEKIPVSNAALSNQQLPATKIIVEPIPLKLPPPEKKPEFKAVEYANFVEKYLQEYRPRLSALVVASDRSKILAKIDFYDGDRVKDSFGIKQLTEFGYSVIVKEFGVLIVKNDKSYPVTAWPLDIQKNVPERTKPELKTEPSQNQQVTAYNLNQ